MKIITGYKTIPSLKNKIIQSYIEFLKEKKEIGKRVLENKDWASSGSEYHTNCRIEKGREIIECEKQIRELTK